MRPGRPWQHRPDPGSDADIDQAIAAKLHLALHGLPLLAEADVAVIEPPLADLIPDWDDSNTATRYAATAQLPHSPLFMDFEGIDGLPAAWHAETWPLPLHLRGVLCWQAEGMLCVMPFGSVGGVHPWGGLDYHAWARWSFLQEEREQWPLPGPGDFLARANGEVVPWSNLKANRFVRTKARWPGTSPAARSACCNCWRVSVASWWSRGCRARFGDGRRVRGSASRVCQPACQRSSPISPWRHRSRRCGRPLRVWCPRPMRASNRPIPSGTRRSPPTTILSCS